MELKSGISGVLGSSKVLLRQGVPKLNSWVCPSSSGLWTLVRPSCAPPFVDIFVEFCSNRQVNDYIIYSKSVAVFLFCLTLCKDFARADSKRGMTGICCSSTPGMDICGTSYSQGSLKSSDPFRGGVGRLKTWLSLACTLMGSTCQKVCTQVRVLSSVSFCNADISDMMLKNSSHLFSIEQLLQILGFGFWKLWGCGYFSI